MKILYRVDASNLIGTGHLVEIVTIHDGLSQEMDFQALACINESELAHQRLSEAGINDFQYIPPGSEVEEIGLLGKLYKDADIDIVILNLLDRSPDYYTAINNIFKHSIVILDNSDRVDIEADVCINFSITQQPDFYKHSIRTEYWVGPEFFPFSRFVREKKKEMRSIAEQVETIFVNQGGTDPFGLTAKTLRALIKSDVQARTIVVVGGGLTARHYDELDNLKKGLRSVFEFYKDVSQQQMIELMAESDMAIAAAGNTLYELTALGVPTLVISHHQRQDYVARAFERAGAARSLGIGEFVSEEGISDAVIEFMNNYSLRQTLHRNCTAMYVRNNFGLLAQRIRQLCHV